MNVKHLLMALAVPTAFAACSQDEFVNEVQGTNDGRPIVGTISLNLPEGAQTRWGWGSTTGFTFDDTDFIGACLMDNVADLGSNNWSGKYTIVNTINTNYKYGYKDGWTNNDAVMSEGNYFFYLPYNDKLKNRAGLTYSIPADQFAYDETAATPVKDESRSWKKNQMFIGYDDILVDDQQAAPQMVELHAKPRFTVKYTGSDNVVVERIVMRDEVAKFAVSGALKPTGTMSSYTPIEGGTVNSNWTESNADLAVAFKKYNEAVAGYKLVEGQYFVNPLEGMDETAPYIQQDETKKSTDLSLNFVPAKEVSALMIVPVGSHTLTDLYFDIYTNKGMVTFNANEDGALETAGSGTAITYSNIDKLENIVAGQGVKADAVKINFGDIDITQPNTVTVSTTSQLESIMRWYANVDEDLTVTLASDNVELSEKVYNIIKGNNELTVKFNGGILNIPATAKNDALSLVSVESGSTIKVAGTQNLTNANSVTLNYDIQVAANATLNINAGTGKTTTVQNIINNGALNIVAGTVVATTSKTITSAKTLTIAENATLTAKMINKADEVTANEFTTYTQNAVVTNDGTLNLLEGSGNECTIDNNNKLDVQGNTTNKEVEAQTGTGGTNGYTAVINNNLGKSYIFANGALTNQGDIVNYGAMYSQNSGTITNTGYIKAEDGSTTYVTTNNGEIELAKRTTETTVNGGNGLKSYTMTAGDLSSGVFSFDKDSDKFNSLKIGMDVAFAAKDKVPENIVLMNKNLTVVCKENTAFSSIIAKEGFRYMLQGNKVKTSKLTVEEGAVFQIPALSKFGVYVEESPTDVDSASEIVKNAGEILVGGNFYANFDNYVPKGVLSSAGTGSYQWNNADKNFGEPAVQ